MPCLFPVCASICGYLKRFCQKIGGIDWAGLMAKLKDAPDTTEKDLEAARTVMVETGRRKTL